VDWICAPNAKSEFTATLLGFGSNLPVQNATVAMLDNTTGIETGIQVQSGPTGEVSFPDPDSGAVVAFKATMANNKPTYQFHLKANAQDETLWIVPNTVYQMALGLSGLQDCSAHLFLPPGRPEIG